MPFAIKSVKKGPKNVPTQREHPSFVLGSRPPSLRAPRIKPLSTSTRDYGKNLSQDPASFGGESFGTTGEPRGS